MTAFSSLYEDIGNCAKQKVQVPKSCAITNPADITGVFQSK